MRKYNCIALFLVVFFSNFSYSSAKNRMREQTLVGKDNANRILWVGVINNELDLVKTAVNSGADINVRGKYLRTPLHKAAMNGSLPIVSYLLGRGVHVNSQNIFGNTALHIAAVKGHIEVLKELVSKGADLDRRNFIGQTAENRAVEAKKMNIANFLENNNLGQEGKEVSSKKEMPSDSQSSECIDPEVFENDSDTISLNNDAANSLVSEVIASELDSSEFSEDEDLESDNYELFLEKNRAANSFLGMVIASQNLSNEDDD